MYQEKQITLFSKNEDQNQIKDYLGFDGSKASDSYKLYINQCREFKEKAIKHKQNNLYIKSSTLHIVKLGYKSCEDFEKKVLQDRESILNYYKRIVNFIFDVEPDSMYLNTKGESKRIRLVRNLNEKKNETFSGNFEKEKKRWFSRYCILSRFIQAARIIIIQNRWKKVLKTLKSLVEQGELYESTESIY